MLLLFKVCQLVIANSCSSFEAWKQGVYVYGKNDGHSRLLCHLKAAQRLICNMQIKLYFKSLSAVRRAFPTHQVKVYFAKSFWSHFLKNHLLHQWKHWTTSTTLQKLQQACRTLQKGTERAVEILKNCSRLSACDVKYNDASHGDDLYIKINVNALVFFYYFKILLCENGLA